MLEPMLTWALVALLPLLLAGGPALPPRGPLAVVRVPGWAAFRRLA